ncbi:MAG: hypothetical protein WBE76_07180 [Terracidiphilus sp.]
MAATSNPTPTASQLDVVFDGTWVFVPSTDAAGNITEVDVYSPDCGHPHGATFLNELGPFSVAAWPLPSALYMVEEHGHTLTIQRAATSQTGMKVSGIDATVNHCLTKGRPLGGNWDLMISFKAGPNAWISSDTVVPQTTDTYGNIVPCFSGKDMPAGKVSAMQTLSFLGVTAVDFCGAPAALQSLLPAPWSGSGSLIVEGELPYVPTVQHTRGAYVAMAKLAGLDLRMDYPLPRVPTAALVTVYPQDHTGQNCGNALIVLP